jgi:hypothetical protein
MAPPLEVQALLVVAREEQVERTAELVPVQAPLYLPLTFARTSTRRVSS